MNLDAEKILVLEQRIKELEGIIAETGKILDPEETNPEFFFDKRYPTRLTDLAKRTQGRIEELSYYAKLVG